MIAPGVVAEAIVATVVSAWDVGTYGHLDSAWLPSMFGPPESKLSALIAAIDAAADDVRLRLDRRARPARLTIIKPGAAPVVLDVDIGRRSIAVTSAPVYSMAEPGVARRVLEVLAAKVADVAARGVLQ